MDKLVQERLDAALDETRSALRKANIGYTDLVVRNDTVTVTLRDAGSVETAREQLKSALTEGMELNADGPVLTIGYSEAGLAQLRARTVEQSIEVIRRRIDESGRSNQPLSGRAKIASSCRCRASRTSKS